MPLQSLRARRLDVSNLLQHAESLGVSRAGKQRLAWFAYALAHDGNVSLTCRYFGISRSTFLRWARRFDPRRPETLEERSRRPHHVRPVETDAATVALIRTYRLASPTMGKEQIARTLQREHSVAVSASTVGRVIARERLFFADLPSHHHKRTGLDFSIAPTKGRADACVAPASSVSAAEIGEAGPVIEGSSDLPVFGS